MPCFSPSRCSPHIAPIKASLYPTALNWLSLHHHLPSNASAIVSILSPALLHVPLRARVVTGTGRTTPWSWSMNGPSNRSSIGERGKLLWSLRVGKGGKCSLISFRRSLRVADRVGGGVGGWSSATVRERFIAPACWRRGPPMGEGNWSRTPPPGYLSGSSRLAGTERCEHSDIARRIAFLCCSALPMKQGSKSSSSSPSCDDPSAFGRSSLLSR